MRKIMIIEDDPSTRDELALLLENEGFQVLAVTDFTDIIGQFAKFDSRHGLQQTLSETRNAGMQQTPSVTRNIGTQQTPSVTYNSGMQQTPSVTCNSGMQQTPSVTCNSGMQQTPSVTCNSGMQQTPSVTRNSGMQQTPSAPCDLILLDLGLPGKNGFTLCMEIRRISKVPILFLTGRDSALDELQALNLGGDDYIVKPYNAPLLLAHINALLRRTSSVQEPDLLEAGGLSVHLTRGTASAAGKCIELTRNELRILVHLMRHTGEIVSRADLIDALWDAHIYIDDNTLSVNMTRLRGKLAELGLPDYIKTRRGMGYQFFNPHYKLT